MILPRSGLGHKHGKVVTLGKPRLLRPDLISAKNGQLMMYDLEPRQDTRHSPCSHMDRLAQMVIVPAAQVAFEVVRGLSRVGPRRRRLRQHGG